MLRRTIEIEVPPALHAWYEQFMTNVQIQLGEEAFTALWAQGRTITRDQVLTVGEPAEPLVSVREESQP